eukprot:2104002-Pyramimonas_sp.AAC.1
MSPIEIPKLSGTRWSPRQAVTVGTKVRYKLYLRVVVTATFCQTDSTTSAFASPPAKTHFVAYVADNWAGATVDILAECDDAMAADAFPTILVSL